MLRAFAIVGAWVVTVSFLAGGGLSAYVFGLIGAVAGVVLAFVVAGEPVSAPARDTPTGGFPVIHVGNPATPGNPENKENGTHLD